MTSLRGGRIPFPNNNTTEDEMPKRKTLTGTLALIDAGERAKRAERKVSSVEKALSKAIKARADAKAEYLALVRQNLSELLQESPAAAQEVTTQTAA